MKKIVVSLFGGLVLFATVACQQTSNAQAQSEPSQTEVSPSLAEIIAEKQLTGKALSFYINKAEYYLEVRFDSVKLKRYPVVFGPDPVNDKLQQGDRRTPEGEFKVRDHYDHAQWRYFIWIDYPTEDSWRKHNQAKAAGEIGQDASIGGEIGIHGVPEGYDYAIGERMNWTLGCISLTNKDLEELIPIVETGMKITIE
ncbi:MAG: L,D-transpeptidase [Bacteroidota bacterium]